MGLDSDGPDARDRGGIAGFTIQQRDVLGLMALGRTDKEIADALFISRATASKHIARIMAKLQVDSRTRGRCHRHPPRAHLLCLGWHRFGPATPVTNVRCPVSTRPIQP